MRFLLWKLLSSLCVMDVVEWMYSFVCSKAANRLLFLIFIAPMNNCGTVIVHFTKLMLSFSFRQQLFQWLYFFHCLWYTRCVCVCAASIGPSIYQTDTHVHSTAHWPHWHLHRCVISERLSPAEAVKLISIAFHSSHLLRTQKVLQKRKMIFTIFFLRFSVSLFSGGSPFRQIAQRIHPNLIDEWTNLNSVEKKKV